METRSGRAGAVWGGFLIILGGVLLLEVFVDLSAWVWVGFLAATGLVIYGIYATDRTQKGLMIPSYALLAIAGLVALIELDILRDDAIAVYVLSAIAFPFLVGYLRNRKAWGLLIPAYVMIAVAGMLALTALDILEGNVVVAYIMFTIALPFLLVYVRNTKMWWALIPGGIMAIIGIAFLLTEDLVRYIGPGIIILIGVWILFRAFFRPATQVKEVAPPPSIEIEVAEVEPESIETEEQEPTEE